MDSVEEEEAGGGGEELCISQTGGYSLADHIYSGDHTGKSTVRPHKWSMISSSVLENQPFLPM